MYTSRVLAATSAHSGDDDGGCDDNAVLHSCSENVIWLLLFF